MAKNTLLKSTLYIVIQYEIKSGTGAHWLSVWSWFIDPIVGGTFRVNSKSDSSLPVPTREKVYSFAPFVDHDNSCQAFLKKKKKWKLRILQIKFPMDIGQYYWFNVEMIHYWNRMKS